MRALSLLLVFVLAKVAILSGRPLPLSGWTPIAYFWQDVLFVLLLVAAGALLRAAGVKAGQHRLLYWTLAVYTALNIPVGRVLSTPLTLPMLRATRGALLDSLAVHLTWTNGGLIAVTLAVAAVPFLLRGAAGRVRVLRPILLASGLAIVALGPSAGRRVDTAGLDRNVVTALVASAFPHVTAHAATTTCCTSAFGVGRPEPLSRFQDAARNRNVVLVSLESTAAQYLGLYGATNDPAPNLTRLAANAIVFENAYAAYPESIKGLFSILCSTFPAFDTPEESYARFSCPALPAALRNAGYRTALFHSGRFAYLGMESIIRNRGYQMLADAGDIGGHRNSSFGVDEPSTVARMLSWIDGGSRAQPFFLTYLPIAGHHPYDAPEGGPFPGDDDMGRYRNALHYGDASLGALVEGLRRRGLEDTTLWIILGDHGEAFGQHPGNYGHTFFLYDENIHVPLVIAAPGATTGQTRIQKVVSLVDTAPSILDLLGLPGPEQYQGQSMLRDGQRMALFFADYSLGLVGLRDGPWKAIHDLHSTRSALFNLDRDPMERTDVSADHREQMIWYRRQLLDWSAAQKARLASSPPALQTPKVAYSDGHDSDRPRRR